VYVYATLGWELNGYDALKEVWAQYMPTWGEGRSYPTRILGEVNGGTGSVMLEFTDTPELFGADLRVDGKSSLPSTLAGNVGPLAIATHHRSTGKSPWTARQTAGDPAARADPLRECGFRSTASTILKENGFHPDVSCAACGSRCLPSNTRRRTETR
jgi:hypothetical protein